MNRRIKRRKKRIRREKGEGRNKKSEEKNISVVISAAKDFLRTQSKYIAKVNSLINQIVTSTNFIPINEKTSDNKERKLV